MPTYYFDTETNLIIPGLLAPEIICEQFALDDDEVTVRSHAEFGFLVDFRAVVDDGKTLIEAHNLSYDLAVVCAHDPSLVQSVFRMLAQGRGRDTGVLEKLKRTAEGTIQRPDRGGPADLGSLVEKYCGFTLDKGEEGFRTRYVTLKGLPANRYPPEAIKYASEDVTGLRALSNALRAKFSSPDEWFQVAAAFALHLCAVWGVRTDPVMLKDVEVKLLARKDEAERILEKAGFFREGSVNKKAVQAAVEDAFRRIGKPVPKSEPTKKFADGQTKTDSETVEEAAQYHPDIAQLVGHGHASKILATYVEPMKLGTTWPMNSRPNVLLASGRTSWGVSELELLNPWRDLSKKWKPTKVKVGTSMQVFPKEDGIRDCIVPRPGFWWCSVDYDSLELRTLGQACLWVCGESVLASRYKADPNYDPHTDLASQIMGVSYADGIQLKKAGDKRLKEHRQMAKAANFGYPGGMSPNRFRDYAKGTYGVDLTLEQARDLRERWFEAFPEMTEYFAYVSFVTNTQKPMRQFVSGRIRGDVGYCDGANTLFQGLAADGAKLALFRVSMAAYAEPQSPLFGSRPVAFIHDEICLEIPSVAAHETAMETVRVMESAMQEVCPDVPIKASPALSTRWIKAAEAKYDGLGRIVPWDL